MIWTTLPSLLAIALFSPTGAVAEPVLRVPGEPLAGLPGLARRRRCAGNDLDQFLRDPRLPGAVVSQRQGVDQLAGVLGRAVHGGHPGPVFGGVRLEEDPVELEFDVPGDEPAQDDSRRRLEQVVGPPRGRGGGGELQGQEASGPHDLRDDAPELVVEDPDRVDVPLDEPLREGFRDPGRVLVGEAAEDAGAAVDHFERAPLPEVVALPTDRDEPEALDAAGLRVTDELARRALDVRVEPPTETLVAGDDEEDDPLLLAEAQE